MNKRAFQILQRLMGQAPPLPPDTRNPAAVALAALGAAKGGRARAVSLSARKRKQIAAKAARARWRRPKK